MNEIEVAFGTGLLLIMIIVSVMILFALASSLSSSNTCEPMPSYKCVKCTYKEECWYFNKTDGRHITHEERLSEKEQ